MTVIACASAAARVLADAGFGPDDARRDASVLARHALGWTLTDWAARNREAAPPDFDAHLLTLTRRRATHEPVAYITGVREFYGRAFTLTRAALIPRPETEAIIEEALALLGSSGARGLGGPGSTDARDDPARHLTPDELEHLRTRVPVIVDVGTGSGCLAITLALECPSARVIATDVSREALDLARANARALGASRVEFVEASRLPADLMPRPDIIVSNPPYVPERDRASLPADVRDFEPASALFAGWDGLDVIRELIREARVALAPGGWLLMEIGAGQAEAVSNAIRQAGLQLDGIRPDLQGIPRLVMARQPAA